MYTLLSGGTNGSTEGGRGFGVGSQGSSTNIFIHQACINTLVSIYYGKAQRDLVSLEDDGLMRKDEASQAARVKAQSELQANLRGEAVPRL